jgi:hypothetical protein
MKIGDALRSEEMLYAQMKKLNDEDDARMARGEAPLGFGADVG